MSARQRAEAFKEKGNRAFGEKKFDEAINFYSEAIKIDARNHVYFSNRSAAYMGKNMYSNALEDAEQCVKLNPKWGKGYFRRAVALLALSRASDAEAVLQEGIRADPTNSDLRAKLDEVHKTLEKERRFVDKEGKPLSGSQLAKAEGNDHFSNGRYEEAAACYTKALELTQDHAERSVLYSNRAACHSQHQNWHAMLDDCNKAIEENPKNVKATMRRGLAYEGLEKYQLAINDMKKVLELDPTARTASAAIARLSRFIN